MNPRIPPSDLDAEAAVLSAVMLDPAALDKCVPHLPSGDLFYSGAHRQVYAAALALSAEGKPVDIVQIGTWLKDRDQIRAIGGMAWLTALLNDSPATQHVEAHAKTVAEKAAVRKLIATCQRIAEQGYLDYGEAREFFDGAEQSVHDAASALAGGRLDTFDHIRTATKTAFEEVAKAAQSGDGITGTRTGLTELDRLITGLHGGEVYVIAGRPGMGKSALAFGIGGFIASHGLGAFGATLEMPSKQVALRLVCSDAGTSGAKTRSARLTESQWVRLTDSAKRVGQLPFWLDERAGASVANIRSGVRRSMRECEKLNIRLGVVIVDYLQLARGVSPSKGRVVNREQEVSEISRSMKEIAKEFDVPVLALAQLNRDCEKRADKRPLLSDLRESGSIEQDADAVIFVYRDKVYDAESQAGDTAELIVAKQRQGPTSMVKVAFDEATTTFRNLEAWAPYDPMQAQSREYADRISP